MPKLFVHASRVGGAWAVHHPLVVGRDRPLTHAQRERVVADGTAAVARRVRGAFSIFEASLGDHGRITDIVVGAAAFFQESLPGTRDGSVFHTIIVHRLANFEVGVGAIACTGSLVFGDAWSTNHWRLWVTRNNRVDEGTKTQRHATEERAVCRRGGR